MWWLMSLVQQRSDCKNASGWLRELRNNLFIANQIIFLEHMTFVQRHVENVLIRAQKIAEANSSTTIKSKTVHG